MTYQVTSKSSPVFEGSLGQTSLYQFTVSRTNTTVAETLNWAVQLQKNADVNNRSAWLTDFPNSQLPSGIASFEIGQSSCELSVPIVGNNTDQFGSRIFKVGVVGTTAFADAAIIDDDDTPGTISEGNPKISAGSSLSTWISTSDVDVYRMDLEAGKNYTVSVIQIADLAIASGNFDVLDAWGAKIAHNSYIGPGGSYSTTFKADASGMYLLQLAGSYNHGGYTISLANLNHNVTGTVTISGNSTQGQTLSASNTLADLDGLGVITYQWKSSTDGNVWADVSTGSSLTLGQTQVGKQIKVVASYTDGNGTAESVASTAKTAITNVNDAPTVNSSIAAQSVAEGNAFLFAVPSGTFVDVDAGDTLSLSATLTGGKALPKWLEFNAATGIFSGTPSSTDTGSLSVQVTAKDKAKAFVSTTFSLTIEDVNQAPIAKAVADQKLTEGKAFSLALPKGTFTDSDKGDVLHYSSDDLQSWLSIDSATGKLTGTPSYVSSGTQTVTLKATDGGGLSATTSVKLTIADTPKISGTANADTLVAGSGNDSISGLAGNDSLSGGEGNDTLTGGEGVDTLTGGVGIDRFVFDTKLGTTNIDIINDFVSGTDKLVLSPKIFAKLKGDTDLSDNFGVKAAATTAKEYLLFNATDHTLYYDIDGSGTTSSPIAVSVIVGVDNLTYTDIALGA